jgi:signal transduction histidine kinase
LFVAREIIEEHGGNIQVNSKTGEGTTFTIRLPSEEI